MDIMVQEYFDLAEGLEYVPYDGNDILPNAEFDYKSKKWRKKRAAILKRDKYLCQECKKYGRMRDAITVHHIRHADTNQELAYVDSNLISLCQACHNKMHPEKGGRKY